MSAHSKTKTKTEPKPAITLTTLDEKANRKIAGLLQLINNQKKVTDEQLKFIENAIKKTLSETNTDKEKYYLIGDNTESKTRRVGFSPSTKKNGGKTKKSKKSRRNKRF
jgi:hypothetical protein